MGLLSRLSTALARAGPAPAAPAAPAVGPVTKRGYGLSPQDSFWAQAQAEKLFGPFNPRVIPDRVLKFMGSDWSIGFCREIWLSGFGAVDYFFEGGDPEIRAFFEATLEDRLPQWRETLLSALDYGRALSEIVWRVADVEYTVPGAGGDRVRTKPAAYLLDDLRGLDPELWSILADEMGDFAGACYQNANITADRLLLVVNESEFGALHGRSLNHRAYIPWWRGNYAYLLCDRYLEKKGDPPIIGFAPTDERVDGKGNIQDPVKVMGAGLSNIRSGSSYVLPNEFDPESQQPMWAVKTLEVAQRAPEFLAVIDRHEFNKRLAWLIPGQLGSGGSFASDKVAQQLVDRFFDRRLVSLFLGPVNRFILPRVARLNFPGCRQHDIPKLCAGSMSSNARETFAEILRNALTLETVLPDSRIVKVAHTIDMMKSLKKLGIARVDPSLIPDAPEPIDVSGGAPEGRPPSIATDPNRPDAPSRPGQTGLSRRGAVALDISSPEEFWTATKGALAAIDDRVARAERIAEDHRKAAQEQIRAVMRKRLLGAKTTETSDGREVISTRNRKLADEVEAEIDAKLDAVINEDLLDEKDLDAATVKFSIARRLSHGAGLAAERALVAGLTLAARSPLVDQHVGVAGLAGGLLNTLGVAAPTQAGAKKVVADVFRDGRRNGQGVIQRETRRVAENVERIVQGGMTPDAAEKVVDTYELPRKEFVESTVHHVRASARATLAWDGALKDPERKWVVAVGPETEAKLLKEAPSGEVADQLYRTRTTRELDDLFSKRAQERGSLSTWRNLGLNYFSEEMYVPIPDSGGDLGLAILATAAAARAEWEKKRKKAQDEMNAAADGAKPMSRMTIGIEVIP